MKYLKLFEQFDDEDSAIWRDDDPFGEDFEYEYDKNKLRVIRNPTGVCYLGYTDGDRLTYFGMTNTSFKVYNFELNPIVEEKEMIRFCDPTNIYAGGERYAGKDSRWKCYRYRNLPQEIKDML